MWSNQFSVSANYLPGSSGWNDFPYIMVGVDASNVAHIGVSVQASAAVLSTLQAQIGYVTTAGDTLIGSPVSFDADGTAAIDISSFPLDGSIFDTNSKYCVFVYGEVGMEKDTNDWCQIVFSDQSMTNITTGVAYLGLNAVLGYWAFKGYTDAYNFLNAFMTGVSPVAFPGSMTIPHNYADRNATLHHNTGVVWTSATTGNIPLYKYNNVSNLSRHVQANPDFIAAIQGAMTTADAIDEVQDYDFGSDPEAWFEWAGPTTITFNLGDGPYQNDLYYAMRHANISGSDVRVLVQAGTLKVLQVSIQGDVDCIYSFNFNETSDVPVFGKAFQWGALLQAGYLGAGSSNPNGQVFYYQVSFDNDTFAMPPYTYPAP